MADLSNEVAQEELSPEEIAQIEKFLNIIDKEEFFEKIRQYVEALVNNQLQKEIIPAARIVVKDTISREKTTDELSDLFENWRSFIK
jgi:replicative DNA helicase